MPRTPVTGKKAAKGRPRKQPSESYAAAIEDWYLDYFLSAGATYDFVQEAFWERASIEIQGRFLSPARLAGESLNIRVTGRRRYDDVMSDPVTYSTKAEWVASLTVRGKKRELTCTVPWTVLWGLCPALQAKAITVISMDGEMLSRGEARIQSLEFCHEVETE